MLIIGANPRFEASVLNARIRKRWRIGNLPVGVIGDVGDLRYDYEQLGAGPETLKELADGNGKFLQVLKKAQRPLIIVGQGAMARADGAAVLGLAAKLAARGRCGRRRTGTALPCCTRLPPASAASMSASCRARAARTPPRCSDRADVLFLLGADEIDLRKSDDAFVVYIGSHGDDGAHRADVILPGATYTEKSGTYVNTEGRVQQTNRAGFAPGEASEDWAILRALSDVLGKRLPFDSLAQLRAKLYAEYPAFRRRRQNCPGAMRARLSAARQAWRASGQDQHLRRRCKDFYLTNPIARASAVMAECSALAKGGFNRQPSKGGAWKTHSSPSTCCRR